MTADPAGGGNADLGRAAVGPPLHRRPDRLDGAHVDLAVVGGGIFGVCVAWDAALRGLSVALLERGDFGQATSANHFKVAHGGVRYLQHLDLPRLRRSCRERSALLRTAPHLVSPLPILMPAFGHGRRGRAVLRLGLGLYDLLTLDRNRGIGDPARRVPASRHLSADEVRSAFPRLGASDLSGGSIFWDGQIHDPPRLALAYVKSAVEAGARVLNYAEVDGFLREGDRVAGIEARDRTTGRRLRLRADVVVNAAGPWAPELLRKRLDLPADASLPELTFSRDVALVVRRQLDPDLGLAVPLTDRDADAVLDRGGRHLFLLPWRDRTLVGVWHRVYDEPPDRVEVTESEIRRYVRQANRAHPGLDLDREDVCHVNAGLVLFGDAEAQPDEGHAFGKRSVVLDHRREHGLAGLVTVVGVRATEARGVAARVVDAARRQIDADAGRAPTGSVPLCGGRFDTMASLLEEAADVTGLDPGSARCRSLARRYGSELPAVWSLCRENPDRARSLAGSGVVEAEVVHAARREMAVTLADVVLRRTGLGTACPPSPEALRRAAELLAAEQGWDEERTAAELAGMRSFLRERGSVRSYGRASPSPLPAG